MAITGTIAAVATVGSMVAGNQAKQKAKGQAAQVENDAQAAQAAADAKLQQQHDQNIQAQSQAGAVARAAIAQPLAPSANTPGKVGTLMSPGSQPVPAPIAPVQRKTLLGS